MTEAPSRTPWPGDRDQLLRMAGERARFGGWYIDLATGHVTWTEELSAMLGYPAEESSRNAIDRYPEHDQRSILDSISKFDGTPFDHRRDFTVPGGEVVRMRTMGEAHRDASGKIVGVQGAFFDIGALLAAEEARGTVERTLGEALNRISDGVLMFDADWIITYMNPGAESILNLSALDLIGNVLWDVVPTAHGSDYAAAYRRAVETQETVEVLQYIERLDAWLDITAYPTEGGLTVYLKNVTEQEMSRRALEESAGRIEAQAALLNLARDAIVVRRLDDSIEFWNAAAETLYGYTHDEAIALSAHDAVFADANELADAIETVRRIGAWSGDLEQRHRSGRRIVVNSSWTLISGQEGQPEKILTVSTDVTQQRRRDELQVRAQRMESLGNLASGVAHDLNNVLTPVLMSVQLLAAGESDPMRAQLLSTMEASVKRGADMIRQVLSFASGMEGRRLPIDLVTVLQEVSEFCRTTVPAGIDWSVESDDRLLPITGDPTQILQVLMNLVINARDAMPDGGRLLVSARNVVVSAVHTPIDAELVPGSYIRLEVEDSGVGIPQDEMSRIFEPFFTTKSQGEGTGLGLATSVGIIRSHGGQLQAYSEPGNGSRFLVHLPASGDGRALAEHPVDDGASIPIGRGQRILVVDDETAIRQVVRKSLEAHGYTTLGAGHGEEAISLVESDAAPIDLVFTDVMMPVMDGAALAAYLAERHPALPIIVASGLSTSRNAKRDAFPGIRAFLSKPFTSTDLLRTVATALEGAAR